VSGRREDRVVVVGAGPTGLVGAALLHRQGIACRILDRNPAPTGHSRAIGVSARSLEVLDEIGAADELVALGLPSRSANFYAEARRIARMTSAKTRHTRFPFLLAVPQSATERVLEARLQEMGVAVERGVELLAAEPRGDGVELRERAGSEERTARAEWVLAADGSHSTVRKALGISFEGAATGRVFANVDAVLDPGPDPGEGHYYFSRQGLLVIAPLPGGTFRVTASVAAESAQEPLGEADVQALIDARAGGAGRVRRLADAGWGVATVAVQARVAGSFARERCFLAGDAAHVFGPTGAQGMNTGIQDAHNLAWKLALVAKGLAGPALLDSYEEERRPVAEEVLHAVEMQTKMATVRSRGGRALRDALLRAASAVRLLDRKLAPRISQLDVDYAGASGVKGFGRRPAAGRRLPDARLGPGAGETAFPLLRDRGFNLVVLGGEIDAAEVAALVPPGLELGLHEVARRQERSRPGLRDHDGALAELLPGAGPRLALVRPDGHLAASGGAADLGAILGHLGGELLGLEAGRLSSTPAPPAARR
jgi:2-polyprenyl-6-methoxyphenol hydroxylase-like FAD-dependent oxidoreductase